MISIGISTRNQAQILRNAERSSSQKRRLEKFRAHIYRFLPRIEHEKASQISGLDQSIKR